MPNNQRGDCPNKPAIDAKAKKAIDAADPVLQNAAAPATDLRKALDLATSTLKDIKSDPHHL